MPMIEVAGIRREIDLAVFDKDGTLVDFTALWTGKFNRAISEIAAHARLDDARTVILMRTLGFQPATGSIIPESPLAVASLKTIGRLCAATLAELGLPVPDAERLTETWFQPAIDAPPTLEDLVPIGAMVAFLGALKRAGIRIAILTTDSRHPSEVSLPMLGLDDLVEGMVCGDDDIPSKPAPDGLLHLARAFGVSPDKVMMVGDAATDMATGRGAGAALCVGVLSGTGREEDLAPLAHAVIADIHAIRLVPTSCRSPWQG